MLCSTWNYCMKKGVLKKCFMFHIKGTRRFGYNPFVSRNMLSTCYRCHLHVTSKSLTLCLHFCIGAFLLQDKFKVSSTGFQGKKFDIFREHVLCTSILPHSFLFQQNCLQIPCVASNYDITDIIFSSETVVALLREGSIFCMETSLCFIHQFDRAYVPPFSKLCLF